MYRLSTISKNFTTLYISESLRVTVPDYGRSSGGHQHPKSMRGSAHHWQAFLAFSPPSRVVFKIYFALQKKRRRFDLDAFTGVQNEDDPSEQTVYSELSWRLKDRYTSKAEYYFELFLEMSRIVQRL